MIINNQKFLKLLSEIPPIEIGLEWSCNEGSATIEDLILETSEFIIQISFKAFRELTMTKGNRYIPDEFEYSGLKVHEVKFKIHLKEIDEKAVLSKNQSICFENKIVENVVDC